MRGRKGNNVRGVHEDELCEVLEDVIWQFCLRKTTLKDGSRKTSSEGRRERDGEGEWVGKEGGVQSLKLPKIEDLNWESPCELSVDFPACK